MTSYLFFWRGEYILNKDFYDYDFTTWQSVFGLKNVFDAFGHADKWKQFVDLHKLKKKW